MSVPTEPPLFATIAGVAVVTLPVTEYARLLDESRQLAEWGLNHQQLINPSRSPIQRDPEIAIFLAQGFGLKPVSKLLKECKKKFGATRTPSRQAAYRYWDTLRSGRAQINGETVAK